MRALVLIHPTVKKYLDDPHKYELWDRVIEKPILVKGISITTAVLYPCKTVKNRDVKIGYVHILRAIENKNFDIIGLVGEGKHRMIQAILHRANIAGIKVVNEDDYTNSQKSFLPKGLIIDIQI